MKWLQHQSDADSISSTGQGTILRLIAKHD